MIDNRYEAEVAEGLEEIAFNELRDQLRIIKPKQKHGAIQFSYDGKLSLLRDLQTINSIYRLLEYDVPRPRALLGHEHFHRLLDNINQILHAGEFRTFYISAAGSNSSVMRRLKGELSTHLGLHEADESGDLLIRIRRRKPGWDVLIRLHARPLATRNWRVCDFQGALNGPTACAMVILSDPSPSDTVVNLACGSGTLLIEQLLHCAPKAAYGIDHDRHALACASANIRAAELDKPAITLLEGDLTQVPLVENSADIIYADLPFGQLIGSHDDNVRLYPAALQEAARIAQPGATFVLITHEIRLIDQVLDASTSWQIDRVLRVSLRGLHPRIYLLHKR